MTSSLVTPDKTRRHRRPPADHRFLGFDTRAFPYGLAILAVWLVWLVVVPAIDSAVTPDKPVTDTNDRMAITETLSFAAAPGWTIDSGFLVGERSASDAFPTVVLTDGTVQFSVTADSFGGTADELLTQIDAVDAATSGSSVLAIAGDRRPVTTSSGLSGVQVGFDTPRTAGSITTFAVDGTGLSVQAVGPPDQVANHSREIAAMIAAIGTTDGGNR
ncbi:hypothetical protein HQO44_20960 [Rhodococcus fascians]|uniref:hypothetical protein n=1 Tax=Rhodococcoides fascians TaxID=1828 RepID=UPI00068C8765|nr:hypothetical protein [Rhodococcus fascians]AMY54920.1 hypothetical protein A3L23_03600 [Rhodococcus fascians D188]MBY4208925.1 hypothetical protein [Rhodococcus fascians]